MTRSALIALMSLLCVQAEDSVWSNLFDGETLKGWEKIGGTADFHVSDGCIVGTTNAGSGSTFLCTSRIYGDFVLEFEFMVPFGINAGVQFRSGVSEAKTDVTLAGRKHQYVAASVFGYQYELDTSFRENTGGVYETGRRGWVQDLRDNPKAKAAYKPGKWNYARIICQGESIKTYINDALATNITDKAAASGIIALQIHAVGSRSALFGQQVYWKKIRIHPILE